MNTFSGLLPQHPHDPIVNDRKSGQLLYEIRGSDQLDTMALLWVGLGVLAALDDFRNASQAVARGVVSNALKLIPRILPINGN